MPGPDGTPRATLLFCAWLAWSRFRVVLPAWDRTLPTLIACLDAMLRRIGGVPVSALTDNEKTVTVEHVAGVPVRHPDAKADLVPAEANLREGYASFAGLAQACREFCEVVNGRMHRETCAVPARRLETERGRLHQLPDAPHTAALGQTRMVNTDQTIRFGSVRYSTPPGLVGAEVWVRADGDELAVVADLAALPLRPDWAGPGPLGLAEVARHRLSTPGNPRIDLAHYPGHPQQPDGTPRPPQARAVTEAEAAFLAIGDGARAWLTEAAAASASRVRAKMAEAVELAALAGTAAVDAALGTAALAGRFGDGDLLSIAGHQAAGSAAGEPVTVAGEAYSAQPGTSAWAGFGAAPGTAS